MNRRAEELREQVSTVEAALDVLDSLLGDDDDDATIANKEALRAAREALDWIAYDGGGR